MNKYNARSNPTIVVINEKGDEIDRIVGAFIPLSKYRNKLQDFIDRKETFISLSAKVAKNKEDFKSAFKLAQKYEKMYKRDEAAELYKMITADPEKAKNTMVSNPYGEDWEKIDAYQMSKYSLARLKTYQRDYSGLIEFLDEFPDGKAAELAYGLLSNYYVYLVNSEETLPFLKKMITKHPKNEKLLYYYIDFSIKQKTDLDNAVRAGNEIYKAMVEPNYYRMFRYAKLLDLYGNEELIEEKYGNKFIETLTLFYTFNLAYYAGFWADKGKNLEDALKRAKQAVQIDPERSYFRWITAKVYAKMDNFDDALKIFGTEYIETKMGEKNDLYYYLNFWAEQGKNLEHALKIAKIYSEMSPDNPTGIQFIAKVLLKMGKEEEALKTYGPEFIKDMMENYRDLYSYAGFWAEEGKNLESALTAVQKSIELKELAYSWAVLGQVYQKMKKYEKALEAMNKAVELSTRRMVSYEERIEEIKAAMTKSQEQ